jgi:hypothetical protein
LVLGQRAGLRERRYGIENAGCAIIPTNCARRRSGA